MVESKIKKVIQFTVKYKKILIILISPLIIGILPLVIKTKAVKCAFVVILMATFWLTEVLPIPVTSLFPIILFPLLGILPSEKVCPLYGKDIVWLFFGGLVAASAIEVTRLHERISLVVLSKFGSNPKWLMLGFMITTAFLSLWISNTASTAMMLPVIDAVVKQLNKLNNNEENENNNEQEEQVKTKKRKNLSTGFLLSCCYSATIGGIGSLVGTPPNLVLKGYYDRYFPEQKLGFLNFMLFALPISIIMLFISWFWLSVRWLPREVMFGCKTKSTEKDKQVSARLDQVFKEKYNSLGPMSWSEKSVAVAFLLLVLLWITRDLHIVPGWQIIFTPNFVSDTTPAMFAAILLFLLPRENIFAGKPYNHLLDWPTIQKRFPWDVIILTGGSLAMADGFQESGLSQWIGSQLNFFAKSKKEVVLIVVQLIPALLTEFTSNTAVASIFLPILDDLSKQAQISPNYLLIPMTLSVSLAFMLPVASPPNGFVFSTGQVRMIDMMTTGVVMNLIGLGTIYMASNLWLSPVFGTNINSMLSINSTNSTVF